MSCDCERPEACTVETRRAAKLHRCCECRGEIALGQRYEHVSGIFDGRPFRDRTCMLCVDLRRLYEAAKGRDCVPYGALLEYLGEDLSYAWRYQSRGKLRGDWGWFAALAKDETSATIIGRAIGILYARELDEEDVRQVQLRAIRDGRRITPLRARAEMEAGL